MKLGVVGAGIVGSALALGLSARGFPVVAVASRTPASARRLAERLPGCRALDRIEEVVAHADLVLLTVPDDAIAAVAAALPWRPGQAAVHCSGAASLDVLAAAAATGAQVGSFHPLQTFADLDTAVRSLAGSTFAVEGDEPLVNTLEALARALGGRPIRLGPGDKALYHASAVLACNYFVTLVSRAVALWPSFGRTQADALAALLPLIRGTVTNLEGVGLPHALTGPIARGDVGTVERHLAALAQRAPALLDLYVRLGLETIPVGVAKGSLDQDHAEALREKLSTASQQSSARDPTREANTHPPRIRYEHTATES